MSCARRDPARESLGLVRARTLTLLFAATSGCASHRPAEELGATSEPIVGGELALGCQWPSTASFDAECTATLIHPRVVITAAHCIQRENAKVTFGAGTPGAFTLTGRCQSGSRDPSTFSTPVDWAYCVLPDDVRVARVPITPPLVGCEAERFLKSGVSAWAVGYGTDDGATRSFGIKRQIELPLVEVSSELLVAGDGVDGVCYGDSGGPLFVHLVEGEHDYGWRVAGSTSGPQDRRVTNCRTRSVFVNVAQHVAAIERDEGIDVTPCTDPSGGWAPGPACTSFQRAPRHGTGPFPACAVPMTSEPLHSCGGPTGDAGAPADGGTGTLGGAGPSGAPLVGASGAPSAGGGAPSSSGSAAVSGSGAAGAGTAGALTEPARPAPNGGQGGAPPPIIACSHPAFSDDPDEGTGCQLASRSTNSKLEILAEAALVIVVRRRRMRS